MSHRFSRVSKQINIRKFFIASLFIFLMVTINQSVDALQKAKGKGSESNTEEVGALKGIGTGFMMIGKGVGKGGGYAGKGIYKTLEFVVDELLMPIKPVTQWLTGRFGVMVDEKT
ncbi:MAG: hypothetical protein A3G33_05160 [Omnitrophica bacterium RIFCSPLOWO2_12_FULL_44_17]|uniref:Exosortase system-associated protein, TIGR04073 family n=1 Tax=Candidatus Danuiimicrobium aquiferis TaxID=1801832 RepID=A0A1G1KXD4_9BACT|nr:MAG: hypothetical protein A3B72_01530 [Omnitrophica bacterium RIFCSPHIGHO2_02_FULL_45_28]OGW90980.1 MAG: hypothetical protein A3E74_01760 [Omnitrophica bacterium RIFCSPHIGHO2_12_FULL_44_12]OGW97545.1 MAG: hypothetical protein A3G33_05160 [Omnitrophica bacterium RIFCSPLOWO2_12_FULL_44_17]OGX02097.1 MAG: hypothetical protein A3J12_06450 [Omnitrophica bacterium RIFCSPLOWO2_02_FULL_44_11]